MVFPRLMLCFGLAFSLSVKAQQEDSDVADRGSFFPAVLPSNAVPPPVDLIAPVPGPEIPMGEIPDGPMLPDSLTIDNQGGSIEGNLEDGIRMGGPVRVQGDNGLEIFSDRARVDLKQEAVFFEGNVSIYQDNLLQKGDEAVYYYERRELDAQGMRASLDPLLLEAGKFRGVSDGEKRVYIGEDAGVTTHDVENPNYWLRAKRTIVYPGDRVTFEDLKVYAGDRAVFYLPYLSQTLNANLGYRFVPGARSNWGPYLLNTYGIMLGGIPNAVTGENEDAWLLSQWRFDLRGKRGAALGLDLQDIRQENPDEISGLSFYYLHDLDPLESRNGIARRSVEENRYQVELKYRKELKWEAAADWRLDANITRLSDRFYVEDFEPRDYRTNPAPDNTLGIFRRSDRSLLSIFGRFRTNDFYRTDTRLPEIAYDQARRPVFGTEVLHEGQTSYALMGTEASPVVRRSVIDPLLSLPTNDPAVPGLISQLNRYERRLVQQIRSLPPGSRASRAIRAQLLDTGFQRFHSNHSFSRPFRHSDWLTVTPQMGMAYTHYSGVQGPAETDTRLLFHGGGEAAVKFTKNYGGYQNRTLGMNGLLHVIQPYSRWSVVSADEVDSNFPKIDRLTFTTRPASLDPSRYTAIDDFESWNILRLGARNHLITKRDSQSHDWLFVDTYIDRYFVDPELNRNWSNLYNDLRWQPLPWLGVDVETQFPITNDTEGFSELNSRVRFMPQENVQLAVGYRHLNDHPVLLDSDRVELDTYTRLNESWGIGTRHVFEMDDSRLEVQQYTVHRDFGNWVGAIGVTARDNRFENEYGLVLSLTLKNFPAASLPFRIDAE